MAFKHVSFMVPQGGHLIAGTNSGDTAGATNYTEKVNFRRESDGEVRREGWERLLAGDRVFSELDDDGYPVRLLFQFTSEEKQVLIAGAGDKLYRLDENLLSANATDSPWRLIAQGLQCLDIEVSGVPSPIRWEAVAIDGYCILNNGVDLPMVYREDWPCAYPMYSLRERGIIRCGTISEFDGRLWIADVEYIEDALFDDLMRELPNPYGVPESQGSSVMLAGSYRVPHTVEYSAWRLVEDLSEARAAPYLFGQIYNGKMIVEGKVGSVSVATGGEGYELATTTVTITDPTASTSHANYNPNFAAARTVTATPVIGDTVVPEGLAPSSTSQNPVSTTIELSDPRKITVTTIDGLNDGMEVTVTGLNDSGQSITDTVTLNDQAMSKRTTDPFAEVSSVSVDTVPASKISIGYVIEGVVKSVSVTGSSSNWRVASVDITSTDSGTGAAATGSISNTSGNPSGLTAIELPFPISARGSLNPYEPPSVSWVDADKQDEPNAVRAGDTIGIPIEDTIAKIAEGSSAITVDSTTKNTTIMCHSISANTPNTDGEPAAFVLQKEPDSTSTDAAVVQEASDFMSFPDDGSKILKMVKLADKLMVYRQTGYLAFTRGNTQSPYFYEERYRGERVADFRNTIISIDDQRQMFVGYNGVFFVTPAAVEPAPLPTLMNGPEFWRNITESEGEYVFAVENGLTQEAMIVAPIGYRGEGILSLDWGVVALDMIYGTLSTIDTAFTAATTIFPSEKINSRWFILSTHVTDLSSTRYVDSEIATEGQYTGAHVMRYGYGPATEDQGPYRTFDRNGGDYSSTLSFGKTDFRNRFSEKSLRSYLIHLSDAFPEKGYDAYADKDYVADDYLSAASAKIDLATFSAASSQKIDEVTEIMDNMGTENMIPVFARGNYFQDTIEIFGKDVGFKVLGRTFEVNGVHTRHVSESVQVVEVVDA